MGWGVKPQERKGLKEVLTASSQVSLRLTWGHLNCCRSRLNLQRANEICKRFTLCCQQATERRGSSQSQSLGNSTVQRLCCIC